MADNPYDVLGIPRDADAAAIRKAYRALAKRHHPDLNPGDKAAEATFKSVSTANDLLSDPDKRAAFDRGEIDAQGQAQGQGRAERPNYRDFAEGMSGRRYRPSASASGHPAGGWGASEEELGDIFGSIFGERGQGQHSQAQHGQSGGGQAGREQASGGFTGAAGPIKGRDELYGLNVEFLDSVRGATRRLALPDGRTLDVKVPAGIEDGQTLRLRGQGSPGFNGAAAGDALIQLKVGGHAFFRRDGSTISLDLPVTLPEAVLGGRISVPTPEGPVAMAIPPGSDTGQRLRLRGRGVPAHSGQQAGDLYVTLRVVIGKADAALQAFLEQWKPDESADPRGSMMGAA